MLRLEYEEDLIFLRLELCFTSVFPVILSLFFLNAVEEAV